MTGQVQELPGHPQSRMWGNRGVQTTLPSLKSYICCVTYKKFTADLISRKRAVRSYGQGHFCLTEDHISESEGFRYDHRFLQKRKKTQKKP